MCNQAVTSLVIELQSRWVAGVLSGKVALPSEEEMASSVEELYQHMEEIGWPKHHTHQLQQKVDISSAILNTNWISSLCHSSHTHISLIDFCLFWCQFDYENWLVTQLGLPPLEEWREQMYYYLLKKITSHDGDDYRDTWDIDKWMQEILSSK